MVVFLIFLVQTSLCVATLHSCDSNWQDVLRTDKNGNVLSGSKTDLAQAVLHGSKIRFQFSNYFADVQNAYVLNEKLVCVQSLFHVSKTGWNKHQTKAYWWFLDVCTSGNVHMSRWYVGIHSKPSESRVRYEIQWFVRHLDCDSKPSTPLFCNTENGYKMCGKLDNLNTAIDNGAEIHVVDAMRGYAVEVTNIDRNTNKEIVSAQHLWHVSQLITSSGHTEFQADAYWWFTTWSSDGFRDISRWNVGSHVARGHTNDKLPMKWFADSCWTLAYEHDNNGNAIDGSLDFLKAAILTGRRVRLRYSDDYAIEADNIIVWKGTVFAQVLGHVSKASIKTFQNNAYWYWQIIDTTGRIETIRPYVGSDNSGKKSVDRQNVKWFVDTRPWKHVLSNFENGTSSHGSKLALIENIKAGRLLRYAVKFDWQSADPLTYVVNADNIDLSPDNTELGAQHIRSISIQKSGSNISFQQKPYWVFMIATTTGNIDRSRWTVGVHENRNQTNIRAPVDWFVS